MRTDKVIWFLENDVFSEGLEPLQKAIVDQGFTYKIDKYIPFQGGTYEKLFPLDRCVVFYGSLNLAKQLLSNKQFQPFISCTFPNYKCSKYYAYFGKFLLNKNYSMLPFSELERNKDFLFEEFGRDGCMFVRPDSGDKIFTGQIITLDTFYEDYRLLGFYDVDPYSMVVISEPQTIINEWRFIIVDGKIVASSPYKESVESAPKEAFNLVEEVLKVDYKPDPAWSLDICQTVDGKVHLLEIGSFSCSGLYKCDVVPIVREVSRVALEWYNDVYA